MCQRGEINKKKISLPYLCTLWSKPLLFDSFIMVKSASRSTRDLNTNLMGTQRRLRQTSFYAQSRQSLRRSHKLGTCINVNDGLVQIQKVWLRMCDIEYHELVQIYISAMNNVHLCSRTWVTVCIYFFTDLAADPNFKQWWPKLFSYHKIRFFITSDRRQSRRLWTIDERGSQITRIYHWSPVRQTNCNPKSLFPHRIVSNQKHSLPLTNADQNSLETVFWLQSVVCSMSDGNKKNYDSNYFWSIIVGSIDVFDCAYKAWFCCMLHDVTVDIFLEMLLLERKVF